MEPPTRRRADAERNRAHILDTAADSLRLNPAASFEDIITATRVARTTVYRHFPTREDLLDELVARALRAVHTVLERARPSDPPFTEALHRMTHAALTAGTDVWALLTTVTEDRVAASPPVMDIVAAVTNMIDLGAAEGVLRTDVPTTWLAEIYFAILASAVRDNRHDDATVDIINDVFLQGAKRTIPHRAKR